MDKVTESGDDELKSGNQKLDSAYFVSESQEKEIIYLVSFDLFALDSGLFSSGY